MRRSSLFRCLIAGMVFPAIVTACKKVPEGVLSQEEMASLMADTYIAEGVVDMNGGIYSSDSARLVLKQSIYHAHGVSRSRVDTSFVWYGNHIEEYIKVLDRAEEILRERQHDLVATSSRQLSLSGDSVNIWVGARHITVTPRIPSRYVTFAVTADTTWHKGDSYELRYKMVNGQRPLISRVYVDYKEGVTRMFDNNGRSQGFVSLVFKIDSTLTPLRLYGYIDLAPRGNEHFHIDSISLVRMRREMARNFYSSSGKELFWNGKRAMRNQTEKDSTAISPSRDMLQAGDDMKVPASTALPQSTGSIKPATTLRRPSSKFKGSR